MSKHYALGIDLGGTNIKYIIIDNSGVEIDNFSNKTEADKGKDQIFKNVVIGSKYLLNNHKDLKIEGIGVGSPGLISDDGKVITGANNLKGWDGTDIKGTIESALKLPVFVDNDVTVLALGEAYFGAGKNNNSVLCIALGTGLGGGIVMNNHIYRGKYGYAAEFGHLVLNPQGPPCTCGKKGCWEVYASATGLKQMAIKYIGKNTSSKILKLAGTLNNINPIHIFNAYKVDDTIAKKIIEEMSYYSGQALGILVNIFDPDIIVIAGGISKEGDLLLEVLKKYLYDFSMSFYIGKVKIKLSQFKEKSGVMGSASLVFERLNIKAI